MTEERKALRQRIENTENAIIETCDERTRRALDCKLAEMRDEWEKTAPPPAPVPMASRPYPERRADWIERNGTTMVVAPDRPDVRILATGAVIMGYEGCVERLFDPPPDDFDRLKPRRRYHEIRLSTFEGDLNALRGSLSGERGPFRWRAVEVKRYGPYTGDIVADLEKIAAVARVESEAIEAIDREIAELPMTKERVAKEAAARELEMQMAGQRAVREQAIRAALNRINRPSRPRRGMSNV